MAFILAAIIYLVGANLCYWMLLVDHKSEGNEMTNGEAAILVLCALLSWACILFVLISAWVTKVGRTGYWKKTLKPTKTTE